MTEGLVAGRFRLRGLLGSGGTASVFAAFDEQTGHEIALKLLHPHLAVARSAWDAFFEEVRAAQSIAHPGLAEIFDAGVSEADPPIVWIAMERVEGVSLADQVREHGPLTAQAAVVLTEAVLDALGAAHSGGVVHRDVTPANVMLDPAPLSPFDPEAFARGIRLLDFGLADVPGRSTVGADALLSRADAAPAGVIASVPYASPEQLSARAVTESSDLYQMGATLFFALTGRPPFSGPTSAVVRAHLSAPPPVPSASVRGTPRQLDRVVTTAMLKRPEDRFADAATMRRAVASAIAPASSDRAANASTEVVVRGGAPAVTGVTKVYRTAVPSGSGAPSVSAAPSPPRRADDRGTGSWRAWVAVAATIAALTALVGWSAMAASTSPAPAVTDTRSPAATPSATIEPPPPVESSVPSTAVPEIVGMPLANARDALSVAGLGVGDVVRENAAAAADTVLGSSPGAGEYALVGAAVALRVASGDNVVPMVGGLAPAEAAGILAAAGFSSQVVESADGTSGLVTASNPGAGVVLPVGTVVILAVARTPVPTPTPTPTATPTPTSTPLPTTSPTSGP